MRKLIDSNPKFKVIILLSFVSFLLAVLTMFLPIDRFEYSGYGALIHCALFIFVFFTDGSIKPDSVELIYFILSVLAIGLFIFSIVFMIRQIILLSKKESKLSVKTYTGYQIAYVVFNFVLFFVWIFHLSSGGFEEEYAYMHRNCVIGLIISIILILFSVFQLVYLIMIKKKSLPENEK